MSAAAGFQPVATMASAFSWTKAENFNHVTHEISAAYLAGAR
jgi:hypothetical protein